MISRLKLASPVPERSPFALDLRPVVLPQSAGRMGFLPSCLPSSSQGNFFPGRKPVIHLMDRSIISRLQKDRFPRSQKALEKSLSGR